MTIHTIEVICTGSELLLGTTLNTNLSWLGQELSGIGLELVRETCVPDDRAALVEAFRTGLDRSDMVITIGGLGPTRDDLTRPTAAEVVGCDLAPSSVVAEAIRAFLSGRGLNVPDAAIAAQSEVLVGAEVLANENGTAPGFWCGKDGKALVLLPGPPGEFRTMFRNEVLPRLQAVAVPQFITSGIRVSGIPESRVAGIVDGLELAGIEVGYCAKPECITVRLGARPGQEDALERAEALAREALAPYALATEAISLPADVGLLLLERGFTIATAESCTGGGIAAALTDVAGSSGYVEGAVVSYSNRWKQEFLGVTQETLDTHGAVSEETVREMLSGLLGTYGVDCGIAVSGVAGPGGGTATKPVGLVYIGTTVGSRQDVRAFHFRGDRAEVRRRTVYAALSQLRMQLLDREIDSSTNTHP